MLAGRFDVLIVGGGHSGAQAAIALRQRKFTGTIAILGEEPHPPYERPPLSKDYLSGDKVFERILIRPEAFWTAQGVALLTGRRVASVDAEAHAVTTSDGALVGYGRLVWAAGGHARGLACPGHDLAGVHSVRGRSDVDAIVEGMRDARRVVVVGGGFIGLEAAAVLTKRGLGVTLLEAQDRVMARVAGLHVSRFYEAEHRAHGVDIRLGAAIERIEARDGRAAGVGLVGGETVEASMVIVGIGIVPAIAPLLGAGARCANGVAVDAEGRTSLADIWAVGDCALSANAFAEGLPMRVESVHNANETAARAADAMTGAAPAPRAVPWFWSNQYDLRLQTVGLSVGYDREVLRGDPADRAFSVAYLKQGRVVALDCVNATKDYVQGRALVAAGARPDPAALADPGTPLKSLCGVAAA